MSAITINLIIITSVEISIMKFHTINGYDYAWKISLVFRKVENLDHHYAIIELLLM